MTQSTKDQVEGTLHKAVGNVKETVGKVLGSENLKAEGKEENQTGTIQKKVGEIEKVFEK